MMMMNMLGGCTRIRPAGGNSMDTCPTIPDLAAGVLAGSHRWNIKTKEKKWRTPQASLRSLRLWRRRSHVCYGRDADSYVDPSQAIRAVTQLEEAISLVPSLMQSPVLARASSSANSVRSSPRSARPAFDSVKTPTNSAGVRPRDVDSSRAAAPKASIP